MKISLVIIWCVCCVFFHSPCGAFLLKKDSCNNTLGCTSYNCHLLTKDSAEDYDITIYFSNYIDYRLACCGYRYARYFFKKHGYSVDIPITIHFHTSLEFNGCNDNFSGEYVYGYSNPDSMSIQMRSLSSPLISNPEREYFKIKYDKKDWILSNLKLQAFHVAVVAHEVAHLFVQHNYNLHTIAYPNDSPYIGRGVQEYIASVVQLSFLDFKDFLYLDILKKYGPVIVFDYEEQINSTIYSFSPQEFVIMSIRHFQNLKKAEQKKFLDKIILGEFNPDLNLDFVDTKNKSSCYCSYIYFNEGEINK